MTKQGHFISIPMGAWGHIRPLLHLSLNILVVHPGLHLTLLLAPSVISQVKSELASPACAHIKVSSEDGVQPVTERLQVVEVRSAHFSLPEQFTPATMAQEAMDFAGILPAFLEALVLGKAEIGETNVSNKLAQFPPSFIIYDAFHGFFHEVLSTLVKSLNKPAIPLFAFLPCNAVACHSHLAPAEEGGSIGAMIDHVAEEVKGGMDPLAAYDKWGFAGTGKVIQPPGFDKKIFDYELYPGVGAVPLPPQIVQQVAGIYSSVRHPSTTALITPSDATLEKEAKEAVEEILGRELIMAGTNEAHERVLQFLDKMQKKHGDGSVFYVSFGSAWWPASRPELVSWLLDSLHENKIPFVFAHASFMEQLDPAVLEKVNAAEDSIEVKFAPQWAVLDHPATGYFVSHCGSNSTAEAIMTEKPIAAFPFAADQGEFTYNLTKWGCAIEIKQVKTFKPTSMNKLYDGTEIIGTEEAVKAELADIWAKIRGEEGVKMRENMRKLKAINKESWANGEAKKAMQSFSRFF